VAVIQWQKVDSVGISAEYVWFCPNWTSLSIVLWDRSYWRTVRDVDSCLVTITVQEKKSAAR